jgi:ABC-type transport system involved in cytochrome c biogenesis permease subunit
MELTMRKTLLVLFALLCSATPALAAAPAFDWDIWRSLPVQDGGRHKPLDTLAWETTRTLSNKVRFVDPQSGRDLDAVAMYMTLVFEGRAFDQQGKKNLHAAGGDAAQPDRWDRTRLLRVDFLALRSALAVPADQKYLSAEAIAHATIRDPKSGKETPFLSWAESLLGKQEQKLPSLEKKAVELADHYWTYLDHRSGRRLEIVPVKGSQKQAWLSVAQLMESTFDAKNDPEGRLQKAKDLLLAARAAYLADKPEEFNRASAEFVSLVTALGPQQGDYPAQKTIAMEVAYNHWAPFRFAWVLITLALILLLLEAGSGWTVFKIGTFGFYTLGLAAMLVGFAMRVAISGRAPVTNMYESVIYVALGSAVLGLILELVYRKKYILGAAAAVATVALILADNCPAHLDPGLRPLQPVLRSNFWLTTHVMTITLSYAAFALALGIANITLGCYIVWPGSRATIDSLSRFTYRVLQVGVVLLAAGTILGGVWADYSWGRFWGWDPKEVWALIALLGYLAVLHARYVNWIRNFGLAVSSVLCFFLVVTAWYGVNFVLGAGLHSYGFGGGGETYVGATMAVQLAYVTLAAMRRYTAGADEPALPQEEAEAAA